MLKNELISMMNGRLIDYCLDNQRKLTGENLIESKNELSDLFEKRLSHFFSNTVHPMFESPEFIKFIEEAHPIEVIGKNIFSNNHMDVIDDRLGELITDGKNYKLFNGDPQKDKKELRKLLEIICGFFEYVLKVPSVKRIKEDSFADLRNYLDGKTSNVYLTRKEHTENTKSFPLAYQVTNVNRLTFLNFASSTFISGKLLSKAYGDFFSRWYFDSLNVNFSQTGNDNTKYCIF